MSLVQFPTKNNFPNISSGESKRLMIGCFIGNALDWFDFAIYGYLASVLGQLFFPKLDPYTALLSSYGVFAAAFIMRPIGAVFFGHLGDKWGRKKALIWSLVGMAIPTFLMGLLPTYDHIGVLAPLCLIICRLLQGFSIGGEFSGSVILLAEHAPPHRKGFFSTWADLGSAIGMIFASLTILLLNAILEDSEMLSWGWRLPFIASFFFAIGGYILRQSLNETPEFLAQKEKSTPSVPLSVIFQKYKRKLILTIGFLMVNSAGYYLLIVFIPNQNLQGLPKIYGSLATLFSLAIMMPAMIWGAILSDKIGQVRCLALGYIGCLVFAFPLLYSAQNASFVTHILCQGLFAGSLGFCFGPRSSFAADIFPTSVRYSAVGLSYNLGNALFGGTAPLICALMIDFSGTVLAPAFYIVVASVISILCVVLLGQDLTFKPRIRILKSLGQMYMSGYKIRMLQR